jgi:hypothetical protein
MGFDPMYSKVWLSRCNYEIHTFAKKNVLFLKTFDFWRQFQGIRIQIKVKPGYQQTGETLSIPTSRPTPATDQHSSHGTRWGKVGICVLK